jgi:hypothetical protein
VYTNRRISVSKLLLSGDLDPVLDPVWLRNRALQNLAQDNTKFLKKLLKVKNTHSGSLITPRRSTVLFLQDLEPMPQPRGQMKCS